MEVIKTVNMTKLFVAVTLLLTAFGTSTTEASRKKKLPPGPNPLTKCGPKLSDECSDEVFEFVFNEGTDVSEACCAQVKQMGKECHDLLTILTVHGEYFEQDVIQVLQRSNTVWDCCESHGVITTST